ncbi:S9 family peptidase [Oenococcus sp. UCMA 16435]|nr:S9 family peptidase [Oenococcus sp. UCMA 16435]MDN6967644.1 S9 family peptidase [Oenococcus sp. UCMA 17063]
MTGITANDLFKLKSTSQLAYADGKIFFVENSVDEKRNSYQTEIKSVDDRGVIQTWANGKGINSNLVIVQENLYFTAHDEITKKNQLFSINFHGGIPTQLTFEKTDVIDLFASHDGSILFYQTKKSDLENKFKTSEFPKTREINRLINRLDGVGWFDEKAIYRTFKFDVENQAANQIFEKDNPISLLDVSSNNRELLFSEKNQPKNDLDFGEGIYAYDLANKKLTFVTESETAGQFYDAKFSPDITKILLVGNDEHLVNNTKQELYLYTIENKKMTNLTRHANFDIDCHLAADFEQQTSGRVLAWLDNANYFFTAGYHGHSQAFTGSGTQFRIVYNETNQIYDFSLLPNAQIAFSVSAQNKANEIVKLDLKNNGRFELYNPNVKFEAAHEYAHVEHFNFQTEDGWNHDGWYMQAINPKDPRNVPVLLYVHGGPHAAYGESFFHEFQVHASHGYAVVFVNPRGSTTYGQEFETAVIGHYGEKDYSDVLSGLDYALDHFPELDRTRQYIAGGSYGGFMTSWAVGHTNRFKAAITQRSVINWISMWGTSDIGWYFNKSELGLDLYDDQGLVEYWKRSPLAYAKNVKTPLLIQHGEWDMRCPIEQSEQFYTALKQNGNETKFIRYPQSFHGISRDGLPSLRIKRLFDIQEWIDSHQ